MGLQRENFQRSDALCDTVRPNRREKSKYPSFAAWVNGNCSAISRAGAFQNSIALRHHQALCRWGDDCRLEPYDIITLPPPPTSRRWSDDYKPVERIVCGLFKIITSYRDAACPAHNHRSTDARSAVANRAKIKYFSIACSRILLIAFPRIDSMRLYASMPHQIKGVPDPCMR